jgi:hypothetical protein
MVDTLSSPQPWAVIDSVAGGGTNFLPASYSYTDSEMIVGAYRYRLKMIDSLGGYAYSDSISATVSSSSLPIQLASFTGEVLGTNGVHLAWTTMSEVNNFGFYIERRLASSPKGSIVSPFVPGAGTSLEEHRYSWIDATVEAGDYRYRIRQIDLDGTVHYSPEIRVVLAGVLDVSENAAPRVFSLLQNYPNPFNPTTEITFSVDKSERATLKIYNMLGQEVAALFDGVAEPGRYYTVSFNGSLLSSGQYFYRVTTPSRIAEKKMMLIK